jgi:hypothetical protein
MVRSGLEIWGLREKQTTALSMTNPNAVPRSLDYL